MQWLLFAFGILLGLVVAVVIVGWMLPKEHTATRAAHFSQPPAVIWIAITDYKSFPSWRSDVQSVDPLPDVNGLPAWRENWKRGEKIPMQVERMVPEQRLVTRIADPDLPFGGTWSFGLAPGPNGSTTLRITEDGEIRNPLFRFFARYVFGYTSTLETYLKSLGRKFNEDVSIQE